MQLCNATVLLAGDRNFALPKRDLSVAEIVLLRALHGEEAVIDITPTRKTTVSLRDTKDRLMATYGERRDYQTLIHNMFANTAVQGLTQLKDLRIPDGGAPVRATAAVPLQEDDLPPDDDDAE
jgi:hypothetical protein